MEDTYDLIIIGGGPAGLTAGLYASRARLAVLLCEGMAFGGCVATTDTVENYPAVRSETGFGLSRRFHDHATAFGLRSVTVRVTGLSVEGEGPAKTFLLKDEEGAGYRARAVIVATGGEWRTLGVPGEKELQGRGVSYCGTCDGPLFKGKDVVVVGGGNSAVEEGIFLTKFARSVTLVHRRSMLRATKIVQEEFLRQKNAHVMYQKAVTRIAGSHRVEGVVLKDTVTGAEQSVPCEGAFIFLGQVPRAQLVSGIVELDPAGFIRTDAKMSTSCPGVFAAGDVREKPLRQIVTAAADGAVAAYCAEQYLREIKGDIYK